MIANAQVINWEVYTKYHYFLWNSIPCDVGSSIEKDTLLYTTNRKILKWIICVAGGKKTSDEPALHITQDSLMQIRFS